MSRIENKRLFINVCIKCIYLGFFLITTQAILPLQAIALETPYNGSTSGSFAVTQMGAATYSIPIEVPPGINGMQPAIGFAYSSQGGNGLLGARWSLSGLSSITRCATTLEQDGFIDRVDFDENDQFCMDGQRLVLAPYETGVYGSANTEYRTEINNFSKIILNGPVTAQGPDSFTVQTPDGQTLEYGSSVDSKAKVTVVSNNSTAILSWALNKVTDQSVNTMEFTYIERAVQGTQRISQIDYFNINGGYQNQVRFIYTLRPDPIINYFAGARKYNSYRLTEVTTYIDGGLTLVRSYKLNYEQDISTNRSRITSVQECETGGLCKLAKQFTWAYGGEGSYSTAGIGLPVGGRISGAAVDISRLKYGDFNGDGLTDIYYVDGWSDTAATVDKVYLSNGNGGFNAPANGPATWVGGYRWRHYRYSAYQTW